MHKFCTAKILTYYFPLIGYLNLKKKNIYIYINYEH